MRQGFTFSWKRGLLTAVLFIVVGIGLFVTVGSKLDVSCVENQSSSAGCGVYRGFNTVTHAYAAFWLQFFAPRCIGDTGPDDCIGPAIGIMFWTLAISGVLIGGFSKKKTEKNL